MYGIRRLLVGAFIFLSVFEQINCHFFAMRFFKQLIPYKRFSNATILKTEAASITSCNLKCINIKPCISTLFISNKKKCILLKSFFQEISDFGETKEHEKATKIIETRLLVSDSYLKLLSTIKTQPCSAVGLDSAKVIKPITHCYSCFSFHTLWKGSKTFP